MSSRELSARIVHRHIKNGITFDQEKISEIKEQKWKESVRQFQAAAQRQFKKQGIL